MAGRPKIREQFRTLDAIGEERICELYTKERTVNRVLAQIAKRGVVVTQRWLYKWLHKTPTRWALWLEAKAFIAHALAEEAYEIAQNASPETVHVSKLQIQTNQWMAERFNRQDYGKSEVATVNVTIGEDFWNALSSGETKDKRPKLDVPESDHEIVQEEKPDE
mgnify:CR=1 FL=1|tara:strand:- start:33 stop:524 length:492 start_codon:yes stop_codon:yes gene_type:complete